VSPEVAGWIANALTAYVAVGVLFAVPFVAFGVGRVDPTAASGTWGFRLAIFPGSVALWPVLLVRWVRGGPPPEERTAHRDAAGGAS